MLTDVLELPQAAPLLGVLTAESLKAIRMADKAVCFLRTPDVSHIRCVKSVENYSPYGPEERTYEIPVRSIVRGYSAEHDSHKHAVCFAMEHSPRYDRRWGTVVEFLRVEDELILEWIADANTYARRARLHIDKVQLIVHRKNRDFIFHLDDSVRPDNSARMIRGLRYPPDYYTRED